MELINRMRKNRKGFTLVEIIVVLVILAILAAFTIPTMLGFVNDAKGKSYIAEARTVYVAAQSTATQYSATNALTDGQLSKALGSDVVLIAPATATEADGGAGADKATAQMKKYVGTDLGIGGSKAPSWIVTVGDATSATTKALKTAQVNSIKYTKGGYEVTIADGNASVVKLP